MKKVFVIALVALMVSCQQSAEHVQQAGSTPVEQQDLQTLAATVTPTHKLSVPVTGMSCEMACGGSIRKELLQTEAVNRVQFDFKMARETNTAVISYDGDKISEKEIISIIQKINNGQFTTGSTEVDVLEQASNAGTAKGNVQSADRTLFPTASVPSIQIPSILDILRTIIFN